MYYNHQNTNRRAKFISFKEKMTISQTGTDGWYILAESDFEPNDSEEKDRERERERGEVRAKLNNKWEDPEREAQRKSEVKDFLSPTRGMHLDMTQQ